MILLALNEPGERDAHNAFVDGMLMSSGSEGCKVPPPSELLDQFRWFLDLQLKVSQGT